MENVHLKAEDTPEKPEPEKSDKKDKEKKKRQAAERLIKAETKAEKPFELLKEQKDQVERGKAEIKPANEEEVPDTEQLSKAEKAMAVSVDAAQELKKLSGNLETKLGWSTIEDEATAGEAGAALFLEQAEKTGDLEGSFAAAAASLGLEKPAIAELLEETAPLEALGESTPKSEPEDIETEEPAEEIVFDRSAEAGPNEDEEEDDARTPAGSGASPPPLSPAPPAGRGPGSPPPRTPFGSPFGPGLMPPGGPAPTPPLSGNLYHAPITPESPYVERYDQGNPAVTALVGGIIGYFIGRRRGRIKAEKQAAKIQNKLEKQIVDVHWQLKAKENQIRRVAALKVRNEGVLVVRGVATERPPVERHFGPEASQLHGAKKAHEHLGHMLVTAESANNARSGAGKASPEAAQPAKPESQKPQHNITERRLETLNRAELLALSEKIIVDGTSLRQIYETHLVGERGLRRLVAEYLRGGDIKKILSREIVEHEIDFERDPAVRDLALPFEPLAGPSTSTNKAALDKLLEKASAGFGDNPSEAATYFKARAAYEARTQAASQNKRHLVDVALVTTIAVLIALVATLYFARN